MAGQGWGPAALGPPVWGLSRVQRRTGHAKWQQRSPETNLRRCVEELEGRKGRAPEAGEGLRGVCRQRRGPSDRGSSGWAGRPACWEGLLPCFILPFPVAAGAGDILLGPGESAYGSIMILIEPTVIEHARELSEPAAFGISKEQSRGSRVGWRGAGAQRGHGCEFGARTAYELPQFSGRSAQRARGSGVRSGCKKSGRARPFPAASPWRPVCPPALWRAENPELYFFQCSLFIQQIPTECLSLCPVSRTIAVMKTNNSTMRGAWTRTGQKQWLLWALLAEHCAGHSATSWHRGALMILPSKTNNIFKEQPRRFSSPPISQHCAPYLAGKLTWLVSLCTD